MSLLNLFSKIIERTVHLQIYDHLIENILLSERQYGFHAGLSTIHQLKHMGPLDIQYLCCL